MEDDKIESAFPDVLLFQLPRELVFFVFVFALSFFCRRRYVIEADYLSEYVILTESFP